MVRRLWVHHFSDLYEHLELEAMTTYSYQLVLDDSESITLTRALELLKEKCLAELDDPEMAPYHSDLCNIESIRQKLYANVSQTSGNNFWRRK